MREEAAASRPVQLPQAADIEPAREPMAAAPVVVPEPAPAPRPATAPAPIDVREALETSGLQMVETRPDRAQAPAPEPEPVALGRPRRERPRAVEAEEPLVQVETKH